MDFLKTLTDYAGVDIEKMLKASKEFSQKKMAIKACEELVEYQTVKNVDELVLETVDNAITLAHLMFSVGIYVVDEELFEKAEHNDLLLNLLWFYTKDKPLNYFYIANRLAMSLDILRHFDEEWVRSIFCQQLKKLDKCLHWA